MKMILLTVLERYCLLLIAIDLVISKKMFLFSSERYYPHDLGVK